MTEQDKQLAQEIGIDNIPEDQQTEILQKVYTTLQMRVGGVLADKMSEEQLTDFDNAKNESDEKAEQWIETNYPDYKNIVAEQMTKLKLEIKGTAEQIIDHIPKEK